MWILSSLLPVLGFALCVFLIARLLREHRAPAVTMAWLVVIILIPYIGVPAYLIFGGRKWKKVSRIKDALYKPPSGNAQIKNSESCITETILRNSGMPPVRNNNEIKILLNGEAAYEQLTSLIKNAKKSIHLMTFILAKDDTGQAVLDLLCQKAREGVEVKLLLDALGSFHTKGRFVESARQAGVKVGIFLPVFPFRRKWSANLRNHRKILIVDNESAMMGGMNIGEEYMGPTPSKKRWYDAAVLVRGSLVSDLHKIFIDDWNFTTNEGLGMPAFLDETKSGASAQIATSGPDTPNDTIYDAMFTAIMEAQERVWIVTPYFLPDEPLSKALLLQTRLGRDVQIMVPEKSNHLLADLARGHFLRDLIEAGVKVVACKQMIHSKLMICDSDLAVVGSANVDPRSFYFNFEVALFMYSQKEVEFVADWVKGKILDSKPLTVAPGHSLRAWAEDLGALVTPLL